VVIFLVVEVRRVCVIVYWLFAKRCWSTICRLGSDVFVAVVRWFEICTREVGCI